VGLEVLTAPFPYFGGKSRIGPQVWERFGDVARYIEPFAGSLAVLLARPRPFRGREIVNDADGLLVNTWRAMAKDPKAVAEWADWPPSESDMHARHAWLVGQRESLTTRLEGDPDWFDAKAAG
jgi:site-specific DNA-adenine methylase